ncbi:MAG: ABC-2 family transporter protein [Bdellovibrionales bacterium]|nr:ABC-2 family transporter protein [Bdellovibrionales bacterium]
MRRYFRLWLSFLRASALADFEYRANISVRIFGEIVWYTTQLSVFEVLYTHTNTISGWDVNAMRVFMGTLFLVDNLYMVLFHENMDGLNSLVRKGDLDLYLVKPISSQFMVSCRKVSVAYVINLMLITAYLTWAISGLAHPITAWQVLSYVVLVLFGLGTYYGLRFMFGTLVILLQDAGNVQFVWHQLFRLATRPDPIYSSYLRFIVLTFFPVAFMASVPSRVLVEGISLPLMFTAAGLAVFLVWLSHWFWETALKRYSSASS